MGSAAGVVRGEVADDGFVQMSVPDLLKWVKDSTDNGSCRPEVRSETRTADKFMRPLDITE